MCSHAADGQLDLSPYVSRHCGCLHRALSRPLEPTCNPQLKPKPKPDAMASRAAVSRDHRDYAVLLCPLRLDLIAAPRARPMGTVERMIKNCRPLVSAPASHPNHRGPRSSARSFTAADVNGRAVALQPVQARKVVGLAQLTTRSRLSKVWMFSRCYFTDRALRPPPNRRLLRSKRVPLNRAPAHDQQ